MILEHIALYNVGSIHMGSQVPLWRESPNFWAPLKYDFYKMLIVLCKKLKDLYWELGLAFNTSPEPYLQKVFLCRHPCHAWDHVWNGKSQLLCYQRLRLHELTTSELGLRAWEPLWLAFKQPKLMILESIHLVHL